MKNNIWYYFLIVRDLLTPQMWIVALEATEATFSAHGRVLSNERSRLKENIFDNLMCLKKMTNCRIPNTRRDGLYIDIYIVIFQNKLYTKCLFA